MVEKILEIARSQIGEREYPPKSDNVKYNTEYYGHVVSGGGFAWCAVFVWWVFRQAGASRLYYGGGKTAYCPTLMTYHRGQAVTDYKPGDVIFFNFKGKKTAAHVGLCENFDGTYITTIDGNTGTGNDANGGAVMRRKRHKKYIVGAYRPEYNKGENMNIENLTDEQVLALAKRIENLKAKQKPSTWSEPARKWAESKGIVSGDGASMKYCKPATKEEVAQMLYNLEVNSNGK